MQFSVSFDTANSPSLGNLTASEKQAVLDVMNAAATIWSHYLTLANITVSINIVVNDSLFSGSVLAEGGPDVYGATGATYNGKTVYASDADIKLNTGTDINGTAPDIDIGLTTNSIRNLLTFKTDDFGTVVANRYDALSVFLHEIGHGLGIADASESPGFPGVGIYDTFVQNGYFTGANAEAAAGAPSGIPLEPGSLSHIQESSAYGGDLMSTAISAGTNVHVSAIDLGILQDISVPIRTATSGNDDVYAVWGIDLHLGAGNDIGTATNGGSNIYGEDGDDTLYGGVGADHLYGGNGDDTLQGGPGSDFLFGDSGFDTAVYTSAASNYQVLQTASNVFQVRDIRTNSPDGTDTLTDVERIQWGDGSITQLVAQNIVDNDELTYTSGGTINDNVSGTGHVSFRGTTGYYVTGNFTQTGGTTIYEGSVIVGPDGNSGGTIGSIAGDVVVGVSSANTGINYNHSDDITVSGNISGLGYLAQIGTGTLTLTGSNTYAAYTSIAQGTLAIASASNIGAGDIKIYNPGATLRLYAVPLTLSQNIALGGGNIETSGNITATLSGVISTMAGVNVQSGLGGFTKLGAGKLILTGNNTYSGPTVISAGTLQISNNTALGATTGALTLNGGTLRAAGSLDLGTRNIFLGASGGTFDNDTWGITIGGVISGSGNLTANGTLTTALKGNNTYSGTTMINAGATVSVGAGGTTGTLGTGAVVLASGGRLAFNRSDSISVSNTISGAGEVDVYGGTAIFTGTNSYGTTTIYSGNTLQIGNGGTSGTLGTGTVSTMGTVRFNRSDTITVANLIQDFANSGALVQAGSGTTILTAANTYTGGTTVSAGTLQLGNGGTTGSVSGNIIVSGGATLAFNHSNSLTYNGIILGPGRVTQSGSGTVILGGNNTYTGTTTVSQGTLLVDGSIASSAVTVASGAILGGTGTVGAATIQSGGKLAAGDTPGAISNLYVNGNLAFQGGGLSEDISSSTADEVLVSGNATISGTLTENFTGGSYGHNTFTILHTTGTLSGTFSNISASGLPARLDVQLTYDAHNVYLTTNHAPVVATTDVTIQHGQSVAASSLFSASDADNDTITKYQFWDGTADPNSGHWVVNGVAQAPRTLIEIAASQLGQVSFVTGSAPDTLQIRAFDGTDWSAADSAQWSPFNITVPVNHPPVVTTSNQTATAGQTLAASGLFSVSDADNDTITKYQFWDGTADPNSGHWVVNGVAQAPRTLIEIAASQLGQVSFVTGSAPDTLQIRAFDGTDWSAADSAQWSPFTVSVTAAPPPPANHPPVVTTSNQTATAGQTLAASGLFSVSDADNDTITKYQFWDGTADPNSGHWVVNGVAQAPRTLIEIAASQLGQVSFVAGTGVTDTLQIRAFDGTDWSAADSAQWSPFTVSVTAAPPPPANHPPVVTTSNQTATAGQTLAASGLFSVSDADNDTITKYQFWDGTADPNSGHWVVNGVAQAPRTLIEIAASQLGQVSFVTGSAPDTLQIRAFDGTDWSAADSAQWSPFTVSVTAAPPPPANHPPVVTTSNQTATAGQTLAASGLFSVSDADNDTITKYQFWDGTADPNSGHWVVNGVAQAPRTLIEIAASQLGQVSFVAGTGVTDTLQIRAFDGTDWSAADSAQWSPFTVSVTAAPPPPANHPPVVTTSNQTATAGQTLAASGLFSVSDADNDTITKYQFWDGTADPNSGHWVVNGVAQAPRTLIEIAASQLGQVSFVTGSAPDTLQIRAFDGTDWSAADSAQWSPFNITVPVNHPPVVTTSDVNSTPGQSLLASNLFTVSDADNDTITKYQFWDGTADPSSGHFTVNGVAQAPRTLIEVAASQLFQVSFLTGTTGDTLQVRAFDGTAWSAADSAQWSPFHIVT